MDGLGSLDRFIFEDLRFDRAGGCLFRTDGSGAAEPVALGSRALALLALLVERQGQLVSKDEIFATVWPGTVVEEGNLTVQISALRRILDRGRAQGSCIQTIPGRGYRFVPSVTRAEALIAASISATGNGGGGPIAAKAQPEPPSAVCSSTDGSATVTAPTASLPRGRTVMAVIVGALCLVAVAAAVNWRSLAPWEVRSAPRPSIIVLPFADLSGDADGRHLVDAVTSDLTTDLSG